MAWFIRMLAAIVLLAPIAGCGPDEFDELLAEGSSVYGRDKDEPIIRHFFRDRRNGVFADIGCWAPTNYNTTYYLEKHLGWSGVAVDALPLGAYWRIQRPTAKFFWNAITDRSGDTIEIIDASALSTLDTESLEFWESTTDQNLRGKVIEVETITLDDVLMKAGVEKLDFLSLDINGTEPQALAGFDIKRFRPELVHVEAPPKNQEALLSYFSANGYRRIDEYLAYDNANWYFTPEH